MADSSKYVVERLWVAPSVGLEVDDHGKEPSPHELGAREGFDTGVKAAQSAAARVELWENLGEFEATSPAAAMEAAVGEQAGTYRAVAARYLTDPVEYEIERTVTVRPKRSAAPSSKQPELARA